MSIVLCVLFAVVGSLISLNRYWQYDVYYYDFGIFDQAIWSVSRLQPPIIDHLAAGHTFIFADHFSPGIFLLSPLYWVTQKQEVILIAQATAVAVSGLFLYLSGRIIVKDEWCSAGVMLCYFLFIGVQNAVITDFHEVTVMVLPLAVLFWSIASGRKRAFLISFIVMLLFKESNFLIGLGVSFFVFITYPSWRKLAGVTAFVSVLWAILAILIVIPFFSHGIYSYKPELPQGVSLLTAFFDDQRKRDTLWFSFLSFGFLPLLTPAFWPLLLEEFAVRFLPRFSETRWGLGLHYNIVTAVFLSVSSMYALTKLRNRFSSRIVRVLIILIIFVSLVLYRFVLRGPFALGYNSAFYSHTKDFHFLNNMLSMIPNDASVMTQNNLGAHVTHQPVYMLTGEYKTVKPDYIMLDLRDGQNPNDFFPTRKVPDVVKAIKSDAEYDEIYHAGDQYIFKRKR
ncbi:MAG: DUF2079 domain-containing protein [bacterium]|nr:DUF2079 domain-containing protein [bacterium]